MSRETGIPVSTLYEYSSKGTIPGADSGLKIARALGLTLEELIEGRAPIGPPGASHLSDAADSDWLTLPEVDLSRLNEFGRPEPIGHAVVRRDELGRMARITTDLWIAQMPSESMPEVARQGETIVCQAHVPPLIDGRVYVFALDGTPVVRRVRVRPDALILSTGPGDNDPMVIHADDLDTLIPVGRLLAAVSYRSL